MQRWLMQQQSWGFVQHQSRIFCATRKCNTEIYHFCNQKFQHFLQQKSFVAKNVKISDCKNGRFPCCTSVLHKMSDFGVAQNLNFVVALVIAAHKFLLIQEKTFFFSIFDSQNLKIKFFFLCNFKIFVQKAR